MADERKFRFISPGVFITEVDQSRLPSLAPEVGPVIVGRSRRGPILTPTKVGTFTEFTNEFGETNPGGSTEDDAWRDGNSNAALYAPYAAEAYFGNTSGRPPLTFVRLAGIENPQAAAGTDGTDGDFGNAGFKVPTVTSNATADATAGAFGLFLFQSSSDIGTSNHQGTLAAIFYASGAAIYPTGTLHGVGTPAGAGMNKLFQLGSTPEVTLEVSTSAGVVEKNTVSLDNSSVNFVRNSFNTNPQAITYRRAGVSVESTVGTEQYKYWLGETFERTISDDVIASGAEYLAAVMPLNKAGTAGYANRLEGFREAQTPWFISQDVSQDTASFSPANRSRAKALFKFVTINGQGEDANKNIKISIANIRPSTNTATPYGTFDVLVQSVGTTAANNAGSSTDPELIESFTGVDLNPNSARYIVRVIGNRFQQIDQTTTTLRSYGDFPNNSQYVRVVVSTEVAAGGAKDLLPFGYYGVPKFADADIGNTATSVTDRYINDGGYAPTDAGATTVVLSSSLSLTSSAKFPQIPKAHVTVANSADVVNFTSFFGIDTDAQAGSSTPNDGYVDYTRFLGANVISSVDWNDNYGLAAAGTGLTYQDAFTLDDVVLATSSYSFDNPRSNIDSAIFTSGSRAAGTSFTAVAGRVNYKNIINAGFNQFTAPMFGGFDGLDILEREPLRNNLMAGSGLVTPVSRNNNYVFNSYRTAVDILSNPEQFEYNLMSFPGVWYTGVTDKILQICQQRGDALAVIDLEGGYIPPHEEYKANEADRQGSVQTVLNNIDTRNLNNSYGAAYYPWVVALDQTSNIPVRVPPSVPAIGVLATTEQVADVWFAPAGFNRGGLSNRDGGINVTGVDEQLQATDRDRLYERNINPIASFPSEGIVVYGQKTLQATPSALDRINVRRLLIFLKKGISRIAQGTLFEQNIPATWRNFKGDADTFLGNVKTRFGLDDFRVVLDETTTTPDLVDRNILYAKVFVKPTRSIEFIALDFVITRSGASFTD